MERIYVVGRIIGAAPMTPVRNLNDLYFFAKVADFNSELEAVAPDPCVAAFSCT
jgi:hypothetical protein